MYGPNVKFPENQKFPVNFQKKFKKKLEKDSLSRSSEAVHWWNSEVHCGGIWEAEKAHTLSLAVTHLVQ